jgi:hypothetical protein
MGKKVMIALVLIAAASIYLTIKEQGRDEAFGGALAPLESARASDGEAHAPLAAALATGGSGSGGTAQSNYGQMVNRVRTKVNGAMDQSVKRSSR